MNSPQQEVFPNIQSVAQQYVFRPDWAESHNWPTRKRAPGYPRRFSIPAIIITCVSGVLMIFCFETDRTTWGFLGLAGYFIGLGILFHRTLGRFRCPECGRRIPMKVHYRYVQFHCRDCNVIWLTGLCYDEDGGSSGSMGE